MLDPYRFLIDGWDTNNTDVCKHVGYIVYVCRKRSDCLDRQTTLYPRSSCRTWVDLIPLPLLSSGASRNNASRLHSIVPRGVHGEWHCVPHPGRSVVSSGIHCYLYRFHIGVHRHVRELNSSILRYLDYRDRIRLKLLHSSDRLHLNDTRFPGDTDGYHRGGCQRGICLFEGAGSACPGSPVL